MKRCLYCCQEKDKSEFSEEHIIPQAIGGNLSPLNPFKTTDVCNRCNNLCGLFIDSAFIKNWITQAGRLQDAMRYIKFTKDAIFPLQFLGPSPELAHNDKICDLWLGPTGDRIYHFHKPYPEVKDMPVIVGPAPNVQSEIDAGYAFIYVVPDNHVWWIPIFRSFATQFKHSELYLGNGPCPQGGMFTEIPPDLKELHTKLTEMRDTTHHARITISLGFETRFLAKFALGIGHLLLEPEFAFSKDADLLRSMMWARSYEKRKDIPIRGFGFLNINGKGLDQVLSWPSGHIIMLRPIDSGIGLFVRFYNSQTACILISATKDHWVNRVSEEGIIFVIASGLRKCLGPISLRAYIEHRQGIIVNPDIDSLEKEATTTYPRPPVQLN